MTTTIIDLLTEKYVGKCVRLEKDIYEKRKKSERVLIYSGIVSRIYESGDEYSGFYVMFLFADGNEEYIDNVETFITLVRK